MNYDEKKILAIPLEDIIPNPFQPRLAFSEDKIQELAESIKIHGIIEPLILRRNGDKYEIIAGERRYKAATLAGLTTVPSIVTDMNNDESAEIALVENLQRKNLTAIEEAKSYEKLQNRGYSQESIAKKMGISQSSIANKLRLLNLTDEVQKALLTEKISERHARSLLSLDKIKQNDMLNRIINERLTVRQLDEEIAKLQQNQLSNSNIPNSIKNIEELFGPTITPSETQSSITPSNDNYDLNSLEIFDIPPISVESPKEVSESSSFEAIQPFDISNEKQDLPTESTNITVDPTEKSDALSYPEPVFVKTDEAKAIEIVQQNTITISKEDFSTVIRSFDKLKRDIEDAGLQISMETFDFDEYYQLIIKVFKS